MTREKKEKFIRESWEAFESQDDSVSIPVLSELSDTEIDILDRWYKLLII